MASYNLMNPEDLLDYGDVSLAAPSHLDMQHGGLGTLGLEGGSLGALGLASGPDESASQADKVWNEGAAVVATSVGDADGKDNNGEEASDAAGDAEAAGEFGGFYEGAALPAHACAYCGIHSPASVIKCVATGKWFCNGSTGERQGAHGAQNGDERPEKGAGNEGSGGDKADSSAPKPIPSRAGSHIVQHLVRSKFKEVCSHPDSPLGETVFECYNCGSRNVFLLGLIPSSNEGVVVTLCREPCLTLGALRDQGWDLSLWEALIQERSFLPWLVPIPSAEETVRARAVTPAGIAALELLWRTHPEATYADLLRAEAEGTGPTSEVPPVVLRYEDGYHYQNIFGPLVKIEADEDRASKAAMRATGLAVRWTRGLNKKWTARFSFHRGPDAELKLVPGDEMCIKLPSFASQFSELDRLVALSRGGADADEDEGAWKAVGFVREVRDGEVVLEVASSSSDVSDRMPASGYTVDVVWRSVTFDRMQMALRNFAVDETSVGGYLYHAILGHAPESALLKATQSTSEVMSAPGLPELNPSQEAAVRSVLQRPLSLIQGPPGTGKTVTSATIVYHLAKQNTGQVLVSAPSNVAVDHLAQKIASTGLKVVRVVARSRESVVSSVEELCLHSIVAATANAELRKLLALRTETGELSAKDGARLRKLMKDAERVVLASADVICVTCAGAGDSHFANLRFRQVLIDEATQAAEPECLIPVVKGCKQLILVGDHCQLGPVITDKRAAAAGLTQSLFERLILLGIRPIRLAVQYRMHPALSEFPSNTFYEGALQNGVTVGERTPQAHDAIGWPVPGRPMFFYISTGAEELSGSGTSYLNRGEAQAVERLVAHMVKSGVSASSIGVITPYEGQRAYVTAYFSQSGSLRAAQLTELEIASVDSFQGREKDYIVVSCVRSNDHSGVGFLSDPRRLNVALTRARYGCIIVGNPRVLAKQPLWHLLLTHFKGYGCLVEGALASLKVSHMHLPAPSRSFVARSLALPGALGGGGVGAPGSAVGPGGAHPLAHGETAAGGHAGGANGPPGTDPAMFNGLGLVALAAHWPALAAVASTAASTSNNGKSPASAAGPTKRTADSTAAPPLATGRRSITTRVREAGARRGLAEFTSIQYNARGTAASSASAAAAAAATAEGQAPLQDASAAEPAASAAQTTTTSA